MITSRNINFDITWKILVIIGFLILISNIQNIYGVQLVKEPLQNHTTDMVHISGKVTDVSTSTPIQNAKITLLDSYTRDIIYNDIYTDDNGNYDETINIDLTDINNEYSELPSTHYLVKGYPNPISAVTGGHLTIQYAVPENRLKTPAFEMYNILGRKIKPSSYLLAGVYFFRLRFKDGHLTDSKKIVLTSGGRLNVSLKQIFEKSKQKLDKNIGLTKTLSDSIEVLFVIEKSGYIYTERTKKLVKGINNVNDFALVQEGQQSSAAIDSTGGIITVVNNRGDTITLKIPRYAIWNSTTITITALNTQPNNPIAKNIFPGVSVTPGGLKLLQPATLKVTFATEIIDTNFAALFSIKQSDFVLPIGNQIATDSTIEGEIYHFSEILGGEPTAGEATSQADKTGNIEFIKRIHLTVVEPSDSYDWRDTHDSIDALLWWGECLIRMGRIEEGQKCLDKAKEIVERDATDFLNQPIPEDPCGEYLTTLLKLAELVNLLIGGDLEIQIGDRVIEVVNMCNLRGEIEYNHHCKAYGWDYEEINGNIPFYINTLVQPYSAISGEGTAEIVIKDVGECILSCVGILRVNNISGELKPDQQGIYWLEMILNETWYESTNCALTCPNPEDNSSWTIDPFTINSNVRFLVEDGASYIIPCATYQGQFEYILHIIHQP